MNNIEKEIYEKFSAKEKLNQTSDLEFGGGRVERELLATLTPLQKHHYQNCIRAYHSNQSDRDRQLIRFVLDYVISLIEKPKSIIKFDGQ